MHAAWSIRAVDAITVLEAAIARYGAPEHLRSDNGPEFIAYAMQEWLKERQIKTLYIQPGSPWGNGHIESVILESWRVEYNEERPHSSLGYQTPREFARRSKFGLFPAYGLLPSKLAKTTLNNQNLIKQTPAELHF